MRLLCQCLAFLAAATGSAAAPSDASTLRIARVFDYAEVRYPQYFPSRQPTQRWESWTYRHYPQTGTYVGVSGDQIYVMGGPWGGSPTWVAPVASFVSVGRPAAKIELGATPARVDAGAFLPLSALPLDADDKAAVVAMRWRTSDPAVAAVTTQGVVLAKSEGRTEVVAEADGALARIAIEVRPKAVAPGRVEITYGPEETVFDYASERCDAGDVPDVAAHPVRLADGSLILVAGNDPRTYVSAGADFDSLHRRCAPAIVSADDRTPQSYRNREWVVSAYRIGGTLHALVHNEFHDSVAPNCKPGDTGPGNPCWYNSITYMASTDGGRTFAPPAGAGTPVAPAPRRWNADEPAAQRHAQGYFGASNIVRGEDGYHYAVFFSVADPNAPGQRGVCVMRTRDPADPASWRAWDGTAYALALRSPYAAGEPPRACKPVLSSAMSGSLTYNRYLERWMLIDMIRNTTVEPPVCGVHYALSADLIEWSLPLEIRRDTMPGWVGPCPPPGGNAGGMAYASIVDHDSASANFETAGQTPHLYFMRTMSDSSYQPRNLVRQPLIIRKSPTFTGDFTPPRGALDQPAAGSTVGGRLVVVDGWAFDDKAIDRIEVWVDGTLLGVATRGIRRPDVAAAYPGAPSDAGYRFVLDSTALANGSHELVVRIWDTGGNELARQQTIGVSN